MGTSRVDAVQFTFPPPGTFLDSTAFARDTSFRTYDAAGKARDGWERAWGSSYRKVYTRSYYGANGADNKLRAQQGYHELGVKFKGERRGYFSEYRYDALGGRILPLGFRERPGRPGAGPRPRPGPTLNGTAAAVDRGRRHAKRTTGGTGAHERCQLFDGVLDHRPGFFGSVFALPGASNSPRSAETFPCTSMTLRALARSASARSSRRRSSAFSLSSGFGLRRPRGRSSAASAPSSRWRRQSERWDM
jgi:hypothetical protein